MSDFVGREEEFAILARHLEAVGDRSNDQPGRCLIMRGRRRVGKSRLVEEFRRRAKVPSVFFTASQAGPQVDLSVFLESVMSSNLPAREVYSNSPPTSWDGALRQLANTLSDDRPNIVVIDELPFLSTTVDGFESLLQRAWDRDLSRKPVLLILIGSDLSIMETLNDYDRPFHQRGRPMVVNPLTPRDVRSMLDMSAADAFDAHLITGGMPLLCSDWQPGWSAEEYLASSLTDPTSALAVSGELSMSAEFPADLAARNVLAAVGTGERTFTSILKASHIPKGTMERSLVTLTKKRVVTADRPLSTQPSKETRYRIEDPYLRFWSRFIEPYMSEIDRGRGDRILQRIRTGWSSWRGRAIEPIVRESLWRLLPDEHTPWLAEEDVFHIGGYWTRSNDVEIDLVATDRIPVANRIGFIGSVKWHETTGLDRHDLTDLVIARDRLPGADSDTPLIAVSRVPGTSRDLFDAVFTADDLIHAWGRPPTSQR